MKLLYEFHYRTKSSSAIRTETIAAGDINEARLIFHERCGKKAKVIRVYPKLPEQRLL